MSYKLSILAHAEDDYRRMYHYILERSLVGAGRWEDAFNSGIARVLENPLHLDSLLKIADLN